MGVTEWETRGSRTARTGRSTGGVPWSSGPAAASAARRFADLVALPAPDRAGYPTGLTVPIDGGELLTAGAVPGR
jgi:hypothetical protein